MKHVHLILCTVLATAGWLQAERAWANAMAPTEFCQAFPDSPSCAGTAIACGYCHHILPPALNPFGAAVSKVVHQDGLSFPRDEISWQQTVALIAEEDSDGDGVANMAEIKAGTEPGSNKSQPPTNVCTDPESCQYDTDYAYKKIWLSACREPPEWEDYEKFVAMTPEQQAAELDVVLDDCMDSEAWISKDGVLWEIGHYKIRPVGSIKKGEDKGLKEIVNYYPDYHLFIYSQMDGNDARDQLLADYTVTRDVTAGVTSYTRKDPDRWNDKQMMQVDRRVGLLTSFWNLSFYLNYTPVARVLVAQAFNAYLGISLSEMQGLSPVPMTESQFKDYDNKGVDKPECAMCHSTVDVLAYPFRNYNGLTGTKDILEGEDSAGLSNEGNLGTESRLTPLSYSLPRMEYLDKTYPGITEMPEAGYIFGQRVENLREWAEVLVNSDQFAKNTVKDYWKVLVGHAPRPDEVQEFQQLWRAFKGKHAYNVEAMLHDLIKTQAFGAP